VAAAPADDRHRLIEALNLFAWILDHREWHRVGEVMAEDVEAYGCVGRQSVVDDSLRAHLGGCGPSQHLLGNYQVAVDGDRAATVCRVRVYHQGAGERSALSYEVFGEYHDRWRRTPGGWRMAERVMVVTLALGDPATLQPD
jgi:hypothetical protein